MFSTLSVPLNGKPVTLNKTFYHYNAPLEKILNYDSDTCGTHLVSSILPVSSQITAVTSNGSITAATETL